MAKPGGTESFCRGSKESWPTLHRKAAAVRNLYNLNQGFEQVLGQLQQLEKLNMGHQPWKAPRATVEENRAEVNFELGRATRGARREGLDLLGPGTIKQSLGVA